MSILVKCGDPNCGKALRLKDELAGKIVKCPDCQKPIRVPTAASAGSTPPQPDAARPADSTTRKKADSPKSIPRATCASPVLSLPRLVLRPKRGLKGLFSTDLDILNAETREIVGIAGDRTRKLFGLFKVNRDMERWEILEVDRSTVLFAIRITKDREFMTGDVRGIECELLDHKEQLLARFLSKLKGVVMRGWQLSLCDATEEEIGRVSISSGKVMEGEAPRITLSSPDGRELGSIAHKGIADVMAMMKQMKAEGKKFGTLSQVGEPGLEVTVSDDCLGDLMVHRALLSLAVIVEVTKIGRSQVSLSRH